MRLAAERNVDERFDDIYDSDFDFVLSDGKARQIFHKK